MQITHNNHNNAVTIAMTDLMGVLFFKVHSLCILNSYFFMNAAKTVFPINY